MTDRHQSRLLRLQQALQDTDADLALLSVGSDLRYLTGYVGMESERLTALVVSADGSARLYVPVLEAPLVDDGPFDTVAWSEAEDPVALITSSASDPRRVLVGDHLWSSFLLAFQRRWASVDWAPLSQVTGSMRLIKDPYEVEKLSEAAAAVDRVFGRVPEEVPFKGSTESEVARRLAALLVEEGHDEAAFTIVASGPNGASPHHHPGDRVIENGDVVVCDIGGSIEGYYSDCTRTFVVGKPDGRAEKVHEVVLAANEAARELVAPGVTASDVDRAARSVIEDAGLGEWFIHRTGHGIGLEVHEQPYIIDGSDIVLEPGMAFSIEPGVYLPGELGVRIEDIVVCSDEGAQVLNRSDRQLVTVS